MLLQSDKEGGFVVLPKGRFDEKAQAAVTKNFVPISKSAVRVKSKFIEFCKSLNLTTLAKGIKNSKESCLTVFFTAKTHKPDIPFRTIVSERGAWQHCVSLFLLNKLKTLQVDDPFRVKSSSEVAQFVKCNDGIKYGFSVDVEDLFYSIPQDKLLVFLRECIEYNDVVDFQNSAGLSVDSFLTLLEFYLSVTFILYNEQPYLQRRGVCIGSCVAPILCDIFLSFVDRSLEQVFNGGRF